MDYDGLLELVSKRRSIRRFKPDLIPDDYLDKIIEVARWAPSGANSQPWEFVIVKDPELKNGIVKLFEEHMSYAHKMELTREPELISPAYAKPLQELPGFASAPVFIVLCGDPRTINTYPLSAAVISGHSIFISSLASAMLYMHLAATTLGLGSQWVTATSFPFEQTMIKNLLKIPEGLEIYDMMVVGYAEMEPRPRLTKNREEIVHYNNFDMGRFKTDDEVKEFIKVLRADRRRR